MSYKSNAEYICDHCGRAVPVAEDRTGMPGWFELRQQKAPAVPEDWGDTTDLGDFCSVLCLLAFVNKLPAVLVT